jgi:hypothetical protein
MNLTQREQRKVLLKALKCCRSVLINLPPSELSERMAIEAADDAIEACTGGRPDTTNPQNQTPGRQPKESDKS